MQSRHDNNNNKADVPPELSRPRYAAPRGVESEQWGFVRPSFPLWGDNTTVFTYQNRFYIHPQGIRAGFIKS